MSQVPRYPFRVIVLSRNSTGDSPANLKSETHNYVNFAGAVAYRDIALRRQRTRKVEIVMVIDESTPTHVD